MAINICVRCEVCNTALDVAKEYYDRVYDSGLQVTVYPCPECMRDYQKLIEENNKMRGLWESHFGEE